jgi:hypothetical protein
MSGKDRFSSELDRRQLSPRWVPQLDLGLIAMLVFASFAMIVVALMFPDLTPPPDLYM